jgi:hypothetical protein
MVNAVLAATAKGGSVPEVRFSDLASLSLWQGKSD